jgi:catechol 2,3-dioxygenase-like lactoylglutathione lyase family enzyme
MNRWRTNIALAVAAAGMALLMVLSRTVAAAQPPAAAVLRVAVTVEDMDRSVAFFTGVLEFSKASDAEVAGADFERLEGIFGARARIVDLKLGDETLELVQYLTPGGRTIPRDSRSNDRWFQHVAIITSEMDAAYGRLREHHVRFASSAPQRLPDWNPNAGGIRAFYFRDDDNHVLEILQFPPGKGQPRWQQKDRLFLGIDHTAIVVDDTNRSVAFYRDVLGLTIAGESENWGDEQAHLNNVFGAHLRITTLHGASGPGVELLEYLAPRDGRAYPPDSRADDLWHWQTVITQPHVEQTAMRLWARHDAIVSSKALSVADGDDTATAAVVARDPDGHAVELLVDRSPR